jgi:hypothetical protein
VLVLLYFSFIVDSFFGSKKLTPIMLNFGQSSSTKALFS